METKLQLDVKGLVLAPGELSRAPGALTQADNVNVEVPGVIRSRRGLARQTNALGGPVWKMFSSRLLGDNLLVNYGSGSQAGTLKYGDGSTSWGSITGTVTNDPPNRMQVAAGRKNHYLTSNEGVRRLESTYGLWGAGMPPGLGLDLVGPTVLSGSPGVVLADGSSCAYRVTWCKKDQEGVTIEGPVGDRTVVYNNTRTSGYGAGVVKNVTCRILLPSLPLTTVAQAPSNLTTAFFYRLYRSASETLGIAPSDNMSVVAEAYLTSSDITAGYVDITDSTPEAFRTLGDPLYTNETEVGGEVDAAGNFGLDLSNEQPPRALDIVQFSECLFCADLVYAPALEFTILSTVASSGLTAGDTITINSVVFTAHGSVTADAQFVVATVAGGSSASEAVERTAIALVTCINKATTNTTMWASYVPDENGLPGKVRIVYRKPSLTPITAVASAHGAAYRPTLVTGIGATGAGTEFRNTITFSKPNLPDAVPFINTLQVGGADCVILKMVVLGEAIYIFTTGGVYRLTGRTVADFQVQEFDLTFRLIGRELVTTCDDAIYAWGLEGVAKITSAGTEYVSNAIEPLLQDALRTLGTEWLLTYGWAVGYRGSHKVLFGIPSGSSDGNCNAILVYDTRMQAWTRWTFTRAGDGTTGPCAPVVRATDDFLFLGEWNSGGTDAYVFKERRAYTAADYKDDTHDTSNIAITKTVTWSAATTQPDMKTHWHQLHLFYDISSVFSAWTTPTAVSVGFTADRVNSGGFALAPTALDRMSRCTVPRAQRRSVRLTVTIGHSVASEYFGLEGLSLVHRPPESRAGTKT